MGKYVAIGQSTLSKARMGRSLLGFLVSAQQANKQQKASGFTQEHICSRANLIPQHFKRYAEATNEAFGVFNYDKETRNITQAPKLWDGKEQFVKVPLNLIKNKALSQHDLIYLLGLSLLQAPSKVAWNSSNLKLVNKINEAFKIRGWNLRLNLTMSYKSLRRLRDLGLLTFEMVKKQVNHKNSKKKWFQNYITKIKLTSQFYDLGYDTEGLLNIIANHSYHTPSSTETEDNEEDWADWLN